ncbi:MAG: hypothetical protein AAF226_10440 [Verrucomicrobiota bacterium]
MRAFLYAILSLWSLGLFAEPQITQFAGSDLIQHPTGITFTAGGKLLVVESHTHFAPDDYQGPKHDIIWWLQDQD